MDKKSGLQTVWYFTQRQPANKWRRQVLSKISWPQSLHSFYYVIILIYQYIFLNINDDSNFCFSNERFKSNRPKSKLKKKRKEKKALLSLKCYNICLITLISSWPRCLCILSFKSKPSTRQGSSSSPQRPCRCCPQAAQPAPFLTRVLSVES